MNTLLKEVNNKFSNFRFQKRRFIQFKSNLKIIERSMLLLVTLFMVASCESDDHIITTNKELEHELEELYSTSPLVGFSVSIIDDKSILYQNSFGYADIKENKKYTKHTTHGIASVSKTFIALALMKAVEQGKLDLDTNINQYLPFDVKHPRYPEKPITIRHLATHTSGILDNEEFWLKRYVLENPFEVDITIYPKEYHPFIELLKTNVDMDDAVFLENALAAHGEWYSMYTFSEDAPGEKYSYSGVASNLAAYVIEQAVGVSYEEYTKQYIFDPLGMYNTSWGYNNSVDIANQATLYLTKDIEIPKHHSITKASGGGLITSNSDFNKYFIEILSGYNGKGKLLSATYYKEMFTHQTASGEIKETQGGIFWIINSRNNNIWHSGGGFGLTTSCLFDPDTNKGYYFMTNIFDDPEFNPDTTIAINKILETLEKHMYLY